MPTSLPPRASFTENTDKANVSSLLPPPNPRWRGIVEKNGGPWEPRGKGMEKTDGLREYGASAGTQPC